MQAIVTYCNMRTDGQTFPQPVDNPLASLARLILYHAVTICIVAQKASAERERCDSETKLNPPYGG